MLQIQYSVYGAFLMRSNVLRFFIMSESKLMESFNARKNIPYFRRYTFSSLPNHKGQAALSTRTCSSKNVHAFGQDPGLLCLRCLRIKTVRLMVVIKKLAMKLVEIMTAGIRFEYGNEPEHEDDKSQQRWL